uniref:Uncharacterized protein n=1 Tax=Noctiluca scintillans TaxID=2966 RepID=A0A7S1A369_NOCSC
MVKSLLFAAILLIGLVGSGATSVQSNDAFSGKERGEGALLEWSMEVRQRLLRGPVSAVGGVSHHHFALVLFLAIFTLVAATFFVFMASQDKAMVDFGPHSCIVLLCTPFSCCFPIDEPPGIYY